MFPLPLLFGTPSVPGEEDLRLPRDLREGTLAFSNMMLTALNLLHAGRSVYARGPATKAQARVHHRVFHLALSFVRHGGPWPSEEEVLNVVRQKVSYEDAAADVLPLGVRGGVPPSAGGVDLAKSLSTSSPEAARQVKRPTALLLKKEDRPAVLKRPFPPTRPSSRRT